MTEVITLSSDDEEIQPPKKRIKLTTVSNVTTVQTTNSCIVLSDDEDDDDNNDEDVKSFLTMTSESLKCVTIKSSENIRISNVTGSDLICTEEIAQSDDSDETLINTNEESGTNNITEVMASSSTNQENDPLKTKLLNFLDKCAANIQLEHKERLQCKFPVLIEYYEKLKDAKDIDELEKVLEINFNKVETAPEGIVIWLKDVFVWLKARVKSYRKQKEESMSNEKVIGLLERSLWKLRKRIRKLEEDECNWDEDGDSTYIQLCAYKQRAVKIFDKLCKYRDENPNYGRVTHNRLDFSKSDYSEINKAINRKYKNNMQFPTFYDMDKLIRKCVHEKQLDIPEHRLRVEVKRCFEALGNIMQRRRGMDLYEIHSDFITNSRDPALENVPLTEQLRKNKQEYAKKEQQLFEKYVLLQEKGVEPEISSDSDNSNIGDSESDENENTTNM